MRALAWLSRLVMTALPIYLLTHLESHGVHVNVGYKLGLLTLGSDFPKINLEDCLMAKHNSREKRTDSPLYLRSLNQVKAWWQ